MPRSDTFTLDPRLRDDTLAVLDLPLCAVRLMDDARYPWLVLVPRLSGLAELIDLPPAERAMLGGEIDAASRALQAMTACDKLNVAALGNMVRQLHVHVIARFEADEAWPHPVWSRGERRPYAAGAAEDVIARLRAGLGGG